MSIRRGATLYAALMLVVPLPAAAVSRDGGPADDKGSSYAVFSQPGLSRAQVIADMEECRDLAAGVRPPGVGYMYAPGLAGAAVAGLMQGLERGAQRRHMQDAALRRCMNVKGYARHSISKEEATTLYAGEWPAMRERLADRALAPAPAASRLDP